MEKLSNACVRKSPGKLTTKTTIKMKDNYCINLVIPIPKHCLKDAGLHGKCPVKKPLSFREKSEAATSVCQEA
jgi:hypothetical protein